MLQGINRQTGISGFSKAGWREPEAWWCEPVMPALCDPHAEFQRSM